MSLLFYGKFLFQIHRLRILPETYCQNSFKSFNHVSTKLTCLKGVLTTRKLLFTIFKLILSKIFPRRLEFWSSKLIKIAEKNFSFVKFGAFFYSETFETELGGFSDDTRCEEREGTQRLWPNLQPDTALVSLPNMHFALFKLYHHSIR